MSHRADRGHRRLLAPVAAAVLLVSGLGMVGVAAATQQGPPPEVPSASAQGAPADATARPAPAAAAGTPARAEAPKPRRTGRPRAVDPAPARAPAPAADPVRLRVPSIGVDTDLLDLALDADGALEVPEDPDRAGWFAGGTAPGDPGAAVLAGHVDSMDGPAVFYLLSALRPGAEVLVDREDGTTATFRVDRVVRYPKDELPTADVYAATGTALRLVTCGGVFDDDSGHYRDNVVAYATVAG